MKKYKNKIKLNNLYELNLFLKQLIEDTLYAKVQEDIVTLTSENVKFKLEVKF